MVYSRLLIGLAICVVSIGAVDARAQTENHDIAELQVANKTYALIVESVAELSTIQAGKNNSNIQLRSPR